MKSNFMFRIRLFVSGTNNIRFSTYECFFLSDCNVYFFVVYVGSCAKCESSEGQHYNYLYDTSKV